VSTNTTKKYLTWLAFSYVVFIAIWFLLRVIFFDRLWPLAVLNTIAQYLLFLPLPVLLIIAIWRRNRSSLLQLLIPIIVFSILFGELFLPSFSRPKVSEGQLITVMSFNVLYSNKAYGAIVDSVHAASPDLVGFQELTSTSKEALIKTLESEYPYHTLSLSEEGLSVGLLSRYPIEMVERFPLPPRNPAQHTIINIEGQRVHVFVVHLTANLFFEHSISEFVPLVIERFGQRAAEVTRLREEIVMLNEPVLLMCDCNLTEPSEAHYQLDEFLNDSFREVGWGFGHTLHPPAIPIPIQRIDYVWHSDDFIALEAFVGQKGNSDHLPVVAKLRLVEMP